MFYYQPQGVGDFPQNQDSLVLEFLDDSLKWNRVWAINGSSYYPFEKKVIFINDNKFLHQKFRFRFLIMLLYQETLITGTWIMYYLISLIVFLIQMN